MTKMLKICNYDFSNPGNTRTVTHLGEPGVEGALVERVELDHLHDVVEARLALVQRVERRRTRARPRRRVHTRVRKDLEKDKRFTYHASQHIGQTQNTRVRFDPIQSISDLFTANVKTFLFPQGNMVSSSQNNVTSSKKYGQSFLKLIRSGQSFPQNTSSRNATFQLGCTYI